MELEDIVNEEMLTTEDVNDMLEHTDKGRTKQTIRNCVTVLQKDPVLKEAIKRNELSGRMDIVKEVPWERRNNSSTVTDTDENNLKMYLEENYELTSERVIKAGVDIVSNENKYHPIRDYLESLVWDGIPRIENMLPHFLGAEKSKYTIGVMKMHMLAAISRIYEPGIKYDIMLCLVGSQGAGKSTFFKYLAIKEEWFSDNLDHLDDENIYRKLQNHWIIEMGEIRILFVINLLQKISTILCRGIVITCGGISKKKASHACVCISVSLAKAVDSLHACRGIAVAQIIYQRIGAVIIADSDHRIQSRIHSLFTILTDNGVVLFVNSAHNI